MSAVNGLITPPPLRSDVKMLNDLTEQVESLLSCFYYRIMRRWRVKEKIIEAKGLLGDLRSVLVDLNGKNLSTAEREVYEKSLLLFEDQRQRQQAYENELYGGSPGPDRPLPIEKLNFDDPPAEPLENCESNILTQGYEVHDGEDSLATPSDASTIDFTDSCPDLERTMVFLTLKMEAVMESVIGTEAICGCGGMRRNLEIAEQGTISIITEVEELPNSVCGKRNFAVI